MSAPVASGKPTAEAGTSTAERLAEHIRRIVDEAPPLSPEQRDRLATLLRGGGLA